MYESSETDQRRKNAGVLERSRKPACARIVPVWPGLYRGSGLTVSGFRRL